MADKNHKYPDNVAGKFYVDEQCIACDACVNEAPSNFTMNDSEGHSKVSKQPSSPEEEEACKAAMAACPVEAIGNDGD
ncbi:MAG: ferredoxin [Proteobacteria bacterium]|nr:MAG: ferredoxin [Pseudomonadota bacterium]